MKQTDIDKKLELRKKNELQTPLELNLTDVYRGKTVQSNVSRSRVMYTGIPWLSTSPSRQENLVDSLKSVLFAYRVEGLKDEQSII